MIGTYNAVVVNSQSFISSEEVKFVKRLDEIYGVTIQGRQVAAALQWKKIGKVRSTIISQGPQEYSPATNTVVADNAEVAQVAAIQEELSMNLIEVINPNKYKEGLAASAFSGSLVTQNGVIESLVVSLPSQEGLNISFSELSGNVFEYDLNGELYSGMMYQVDQNAYMVTLTNGPLEGTRLRFSSVNSQELNSAQSEMTENNIAVGEFGAQEAPVNLAQNDNVETEQLNQQDQDLQKEAQLAQGFNLEAQTM